MCSHFEAAPQMDSWLAKMKFTWDLEIVVIDGQATFKHNWQKADTAVPVNFINSAGRFLCGVLFPCIRI